MMVHGNHYKEDSLELSLEGNGGWYWQEEEKLSRQGELPKRMHSRKDDVWKRL